MPYAYGLNEDVRHHSQGPQGRVTLEKPNVFPSRQMDALDTALKASRKRSSVSLRKISFRVVADFR